MARTHNRITGPIACAIRGNVVRLVQVRIDASKSPEVLVPVWESRAFSTNGGTPKQDIAQLVRDILSLGDFTGRESVVSLPEDIVRYRTTRLAVMPDSDLAAAVQWRVANEAEIDPEQYRTSFYDVGEIVDADRRRREVIAISVAKSDVLDWELSIGASGLTPVAIDTVPSAIARCFAGEKSWGRTTDPILFVLLSESEAQMIAVREGLPYFIHSVEVPSRRQAVCSEKHGDPQSDETRSREDECNGVADPFLLGILAHEVSRILHYLGDMNHPSGEPRIGCILGNNSNQDALVSALSSRTGLRFMNVSDVLSEQVRDLVGKVSAGTYERDWVLAVGLALRGMEDPSTRSSFPVRASMLAESSGLHHPKLARPVPLIVALASSALLLLSGLFHRSIQSPTRGDDKQAAETQAMMDRDRADVPSVSGEIAETHTLSSSNDPTQASHLPMAAILALLTQLTPEGVCFRDLKFSASAAPTGRRVASNNPAQAIDAKHVVRIEISGMASVDAAITRMLELLTDSGVFRRVRLHHARTANLANEASHEFRVSMEFDPLSSEAPQP